MFNQIKCILLLQVLETPLYVVSFLFLFDSSRYSGIKAMKHFALMILLRVGRRVMIKV